jgi:hypothetical protein
MTFSKARHRNERSATRGSLFGDAAGLRLRRARVDVLTGAAGVVVVVGLVVGVLLGVPNGGGPASRDAMAQQEATTTHPDTRPVPFPIRPAIPYPRRDAPQAPPVLPPLQTPSGAAPAPAPNVAPSPSDSPTSAPGKSATAPGHVKKPPKP